MMIPWSYVEMWKQQVPFLGAIGQIIGWCSILGCFCEIPDKPLLLHYEPYTAYLLFNTKL